MTFKEIYGERLFWQVLVSIYFFGSRCAMANVGTGDVTQARNTEKCEAIMPMGKEIEKTSLYNLIAITMLRSKTMLFVTCPACWFELVGQVSHLSKFFLATSTTWTSPTEDETRSYRAVVTKKGCVPAWVCPFNRRVFATTSTFAMHSSSFAPSMISAAALRSRSRADHPGQQANVMPPPGLPAPASSLPSSQQLLQQLVESQNLQNQLLQKQMEVLMQQQASTLTAYNNPEEMLATFDPSLQPVLKEWSSDYRSALQQHVTQANLQQKYVDIARCGELHKQFQDEAKRTWQWPQAFKANVKELASISALLEEGQSDMLKERTDGEEPFDIEAAFKAMRRRHAQECQDFVFAYQRQCAAYFAEKTHPSKQMILLEDHFLGWFQKHGSFVGAQAKARLEEQLRMFAELTFRTEHPKAMSKQEKDKESKQKRKDELTKAEAEFRMMDVNKLLAMAVLEFTTLSGKGGTSRNPQHVVPTTGALAFFVKQHPDLAEKYNISVRSAVSKPKAKTPDEDRGRSGTRTSSKSRKSSHSSRRSNKSSARRAPSKGNDKGKGKGKGKGKQRKGRGKAKSASPKRVRMKTPAPPKRSWLAKARPRPRKRSFWNEDWSIDLDTYFRFRLRKLSIVQLERRFCMPVHTMTSPSFEIPTCVFAFLSKGGKFVADRRASSTAEILTSVNALERALHTAVYFDRHAPEPTFFKRCRLRTAWKPNVDPFIAAYGRLLREELTGYSPHDLVKNEDFIDKAARRWLFEHRHEISVVDADKNLGDVIAPKSWVRQECLRLLREASSKVSRTESWKTLPTSSFYWIVFCSNQCTWACYPTNLQRLSERISVPTLLADLDYVWSFTNHP